MKADFDKFPRRSRSHEIQVQSDTAFETTISNCDFFIIQASDKRDYGTDYVLEAVSSGEVTNAPSICRIEKLDH